MDDEDYIEVEGNPYPFGTDAWHRYNIGAPADSIGAVESVEFSDEGIVVKGFFWGPVPSSLRDWYLDPVSLFAKEMKSDA